MPQLSVESTLPKSTFTSGVPSPQFQSRKFDWSVVTSARTRPSLVELAAFDAANIAETTSMITKSLLAYNGNVPLQQAFALNAFLFTLLNKKLFTVLTPSGFAHALFLGTMLWTTLGWRGWTTVVVYFFLGVAVTKVKFQEKLQRGIAEKRGGRRGPENVWGSAATALMCAACAAQGDSFLGMGRDLYLLGFVASLATKLSDTFASEIGKAYGKTTFLITTLERVSPGTEGAVSAEGTIASVVGGTLLTLYSYSIGLIGEGSSGLYAIGISTLAAFIATNIESVLGATVQDKEGLSWLTNDVVNFLNTLIGAILAIAGGKIVLGM